MRRHIAIVAGVGGPNARIAGPRVRVEDVVVGHETLGMSPDAIVDAIPIPRVRAMVAATAGSWADLESDTVIREMSEAREVGSRPLDRP
jgi:uncharacterized protein (DUF433 family)